MSDVFRILAEIQLQVAGKPELDKLDAQIKNVTTDQKTLNATAAALTKEIAATNSLAQKQVLTTALKNTEAQLAKTTAEAKKLAGVIDQPQKKGGLFDLSSILNFSAGNIAANIIGNIAGAVTGFGAGIVDAAGRFEQYQIQLNTLFKSADIGKKVFNDLLKTATETPFAFSELTELTARLAAYGIEDFNIIPTIETLGNIAAGVGKEKLPQLVLAFGQVRAAGKLTGNELRQFSEAGVPLTELLAKSLNKSQGEIRALVTAGKIGFPDVEKALRATTEAGGQFFDLMKKQSVTTLGAFSNFGDAVEQLQAAIGANTNGIIKDLTLFATGLVNATKDFVNGDAVEKIQAEQAALNGLVGAIELTANSTLNLNEKNKIRNSLIADLRAQYPSFLGSLKDEEITTANLNILLDANNKLYAEKLRIARQDIIVQGANKELADAELALTDKLIKANEAVAKFNQVTGKNINISTVKEAGEAIKTVQDRIKQGQGDLSNLDFAKLQNSFTELKRALGTTLFGTTLTDAEKEVNTASERLTQIQKIQTAENVKSKEQLQKEISEINERILANEKLLQGNISSIDKVGIKNRITTLKAAKAQIENTLNPKQNVSTAPTAYDAKAVKDAEKAANAIKNLQIKTAKDLQEELKKLANETEQLRAKDGTKTEASLTKQNQLEAAAAKERINILKKELTDKKALTPELSKLFGDVSGAIDAKFKVKLDIDIDNLRAEIKALQLKISDEITTMQADSRAEQIKIELSTATNDLAGEQKRLALGTELVQAEQAKRLSELQKAGNAKAAEIEKSNLTEQQKAEAIAQYKAVQALNEQNVIEQSDNEKLALQVEYYEKLAAINISYLQDITATADEETQAQINALNVQYLQGVLNYEDYKAKLDTLTKERTLVALGEQKAQTDLIIAEKQKEIAAIKAAIDAENFLRTSRGETPLPLDSKEVQGLINQIAELQKRLNEIANSTTEAKVDIKVSKIGDLNKSVKDATAALDDPTGFLVDKLFGEGIGDAAKEKVVTAINEAFAFGQDLAKQVVDEKLAGIDSESEAIQRRIDAELLLKNANTERVEQERQALENLQNKREQIQKRQIAANNLQRISTLALATAQAILAINSVAAASNVAAPIVIPLVVAAIGLGIAASLIPILGAAEEGDVSISPSGNRKPKGKSDTMLYWVNPKESIINAKATQKYKPLLQMINSGASDSEISKQLNPQEANYNTTANVSYFHKFGVKKKKKGSLNHAITEQINVTIRPLSDSLNEVTKATRRQERQQAQTNEILNDIGELLNAQTTIMKTTKKRTV